MKIGTKIESRQSDACFTINSKGLITSFNNAAVLITGYQADEIQNQKFIDLVTDPVSARSLLKRLSTEDAIKNFPLTFKQNRKRKNTDVLIDAFLQHHGTRKNIIISAKLSSEQTATDKENAFLAAIVNSTDDAIISKTLEGTINSWNRAATVILGYEAAEVIGQHISLLIPEDLQHEEAEITNKISKRESIRHVETARLRKDGSRIHVSLTISPIEDKHGKVIGASIILKDISKQKQEIDQKIAQNVREITDYKLALDEANIIAITDQKGIIKHANDNFCKISKYSRKELIGQDHRIINSGFHSKQFIRELWVTIAHGKIWKGEIKNKAKDGTIYWVDTTIVPFLNEEGKPYQYLAIRSDITSRKQVEENLENSLKEVSDYKYALDESSIVAITDQKGIIKHANHNFCKISKYSREELIGQDHRIINSGYHPKEFIRNLWHTIANGKIWRGELKNKAKDGTIYWVDTTIIPFLNNEGKPYQYVAIRADITQRKQAEQEVLVLNEELEKRVKERTEEMESFSYSVSHDLRAPLRAVNGYAKIIEEDYHDLFDDEGKRLLYEVQHNAQKMGVLIDDLLTFSRLGRKEIEKNIIDMTELTELAINEINQTTTHHATIKLHPLHPVKADPALMKNVMINLISNAIKYSGKKEKPVIEIRSKEDVSGLTYSIKDNGVGFDMQYAHKLFGVFQRLHSNDEFAGTGVGLAMVSRIINKHRGKIWADGKVNQGATFYFTLPGK